MLQLHQEDTFNHLKKALLLGQKQLEQETLSRQMTASMGRNSNTNQTSESLRQATFDKMHIDILLLQDRIKSLEAQLVSSPSEVGRLNGQPESPEAEVVSLPY